MTAPDYRPAGAWTTSMEAAREVGYQSGVRHAAPTARITLGTGWVLWFADVDLPDGRQPRRHGLTRSAALGRAVDALPATFRIEVEDQ